MHDLEAVRLHVEAQHQGYAFVHWAIIAERALLSVHGNSRKWAASSPLTFVRAGLPPFPLWSGPPSIA